MKVTQFRYYIDPETDEPHIYNHDVTEEAVEEDFLSGGETRREGGGVYARIGPTEDGRLLRIIFRKDS